MPWLSIGAVMLLLILVWQAMELLLHDYKGREERVKILQHLSTVRAGLESQINTNLLLLRGVVAVVKAQPDITNEDFNRIAEGLLEKNTALRNVALAPGLVVKMVYPLAGNEAVLGLDYNANEKQREAALRAVKLRDIVIAGPLNLVQGGSGIIARMPVFIDAPDGAGEDVLWGLVSAVIDTNQLFRQAGIDDPALPLRISIRGADASGRKGAVFLGEAADFTASAVAMDVSLPTGSWHLAARVKEGISLETHVDSWVGTLRLAMFLLCCFALAIIFVRHRGQIEKARAQLELSESRQRYQNLVENTHDSIWEVDAQARYTYVSPRVEEHLGFEPAKILGLTPFDLMPKEEAERVAVIFQKIAAEKRSFNGLVNINLHRNGTRVVLETNGVPILGPDGELLGYRGIDRNITVRKELERREHLRLKILEKMAQGPSMQELLDTLSHLMESGMDGALSSILLLDKSGRYLTVGSAPSLPDFYNQAVDGLEIGSGVGSCGTAAFDRRQVIVADIQSHPYWEGFRSLAAKANLAACWSQPIFDAKGKVLGTFALYYREPRSPDESELKYLALAADQAGIAIDGIRNQQRLDKEKAWRQILVKQSRDGIVILDQDGNVHEANQGFADMLGYTRKEVQRLQVWDWEAQMSREQLLSALREINETGDHFETLQRRKDGRLIDVEITTNAAMFEGKKLIFCVCRDITLRKANEEALRASEERFELAMRAANDGLWDWNMQTNDVYYSPRWKGMLGYQDHELVNDFSTWEALVSEDGKAKAMGLIEDCIAGRADGFVTEFKMRHKDGSWIHVLSRSHLVRDDQGRPSRMVGTHVDITGQKLLEQRLRDSEAQANQIIETAPEAIIMTDDKGNIVRINPKVEQLFGYRKEELLGQPVEALLPAASKAAHVAYREAYMHRPVYKDVREHGPNMALAGCRKDGSEFPVEAGLSPVTIGGKQHVVVTLLDISQRKTAEQALKDSEANLREERDFVNAVVEAAGSVIVVLDREGRVVRFNQAAQEITGYSFAELQGQPIWEYLIPEEVRPAIEELFSQLETGKIVGSYQNEWVMRDGSRRLFDWRNTVLEGADGRVSYVIAQGYDITEARKTQQALAEHKNRLEQMVAERTATVRRQATIIDQSHDSIVSTDLDGLITSWNNGAQSMFGIESQAAVGRHISIVYPPDQHEFLERCVIDELKVKGNYEVEVILWRSDRQRFDAHLSLSLLYGNDGEPVGIVGYTVDISERKKMENALRESEANLAHAQAIAHVGSWHLDIISDELSWSDETYRIFGLDEDTPVAMGNFIASIHPDDVERVMDAWGDAEKGRPYDIEHRILVAGKQKWVRELAEVQFDADGRAVSALGIVQDISEIKAAERAAQKALAEAQRLAMVRSEFVANMSHEIRTPLNAVLGMARMGARGASPEKSTSYFKQILDSGQHLLHVVNDVLDFSKIDAGKLVVERRPFKLKASLNNAARLIESQAREKGLVFQMELADGLPGWVEGDAMRLEQILLNLLSNAVKFTHQGKVVLRVDRERGMFRFEVEDSGIGMSGEQLAQLFRPFEQADSSTTRRFGGTGLGLSISKSLTQLMDGSIHAESQPGEGSRFVLRLPLRKSVSVSDIAKPDCQADAKRLSGVRVLAAEDVEVNRLVLADLLDEEGAHVLFAENGQQALDLLEERGVNAFDLVLMDIQMPVVDGYTATRSINILAPTLPVIGLTAHALPEERARCLAAGMVEHVAKPVDLERLVEAIQRHLPVSQSQVTERAAAEGRATETVASVTTLQEVVTGPAGGIDWPALYKRFKGREAFIGRLLSTMLSSHSDTPEMIRYAVEARDEEALRFMAHSLKGLASNLSATSLEELSRGVEGRLKERDPNGIELAEDLAQELTEVLATISEKLEAM